VKAWAVLLLVLLVPTGSAASVAGTLTVRHADADEALFTAHPQAAYVGGFQGLRSWTFTASTVDVDWFDKANQRVGSLIVTPPNQPMQERSYEVHDVRGSLRDLAPWPDGWMGVYDAPGTSLHPLEAGNVSWSPLAQTIVGMDSVTPEAAPQPDANYFALRVLGPTLAYEVGGRVRLDGDLVVKLQGLNLSLQARENLSFVDTGRTGDAGPLGQYHDSWATLTMRNASLTLDTRVPLAAASTQVLLAQCGAVGADATGGQLQVGDQQGVTDGPTRLVGRLAGSLTATKDDAGQTDAVLRIEGDAAVAGVRYAPASPEGSPFPATAALLVGGTVLAAGAAAWGVRRFARRPGLTVEQCMDLSERAIEQGAWGLALDWNTQALAMVPRHPRLLADRGTILESSGRVDEALDAYRRAAEAGDDGEGEILLARLLLRFDSSSDEAQGAIVAALRKSPEMVFEIEEEDEYRELRAKPRVQQAVRDARRATERR